MTAEIYGSMFDYGESPIYKDEGSTIIAVPLEDEVESEGDIKLVMERGVVSTADIQINTRDLLRDPGLETAVLLSLFTDRRAGPEDVLPDNSGDRRGWWGDALNTNDDADGSKLWLTFRGKITDSTVVQIEEYVREALQWLIDDGVAERVSVQAVRTTMTAITWTIGVTRPRTGAVAFFKYYYNWQYQVYGRA